MSKNKYPFLFGDTNNTGSNDGGDGGITIINNNGDDNSSITIINNNGNNITTNITNIITSSIRLDGDMFINGSLHIRGNDPNVPTLILSGAVEIVDGVYPNKTPNIVKPSLKIGKVGILGENKNATDIKIFDLGDFC